MFDLPTFDDLAPVLLRGLDNDEAMSAFQLLVIAGYRIISSEKLDALAEEVEQAVERYAAVRHAYAVEAQARAAAEARLAAIEAAGHEVLHSIQRGHEHEVNEAVDALSLALGDSNWCYRP